MKESARYLKIVEWSEEDQCYIGQCPGIIGPCCHGDNEAQVELMNREKKPLPLPTIGKHIAERILEAV